MLGRLRTVADQIGNHDFAKPEAASPSVPPLQFSLAFVPVSVPSWPSFR